MGPQVNVVIWIRDLMGVFGPICSWEDWESRDQAEAADRAWWIANDHIGNLDGWRLAAREEFEMAAQGLTIGPGDIVVVEGEAFLCTESGMEPTEFDEEEWADY